MLAAYHMESGATSLRLLSHLAKTKKELEYDFMNDDTMILESLERELNNKSNSSLREKLLKLGELVSRITSVNIPSSTISDAVFIDGKHKVKFRDHSITEKLHLCKI